MDSPPFQHLSPSSWPLPVWLSPSFPLCLLHASRTNSAASLLIAAVDQSCSSAVCPLVSWPHHNRGIWGWQLPPAKPGQTRGQSGWWGVVAYSGLLSSRSQLQPWETAGPSLTSWLVGVSPVTTAIRSKSLAWNMTSVCGIWIETLPQPN